MKDTRQDSTLRGNALDAELGNSGAEEKVQVEKKELKKMIHFYKLFSFADSMDKVLMIIGTVGAIGNGVSQILMTLIFGNLIDVFARAQRTDTISIVSKSSQIP